MWNFDSDNLYYTIKTMIYPIKWYFTQIMILFCKIVWYCHINTGTCNTVKNVRIQSGYYCYEFKEVSHCVHILTLNIYKTSLYSVW